MSIFLALASSLLASQLASPKLLWGVSSMEEEYREACCQLERLVIPPRSRHQLARSPSTSLRHRCRL